MRSLNSCNKFLHFASGAQAARGLHMQLFLLICRVLNSSKSSAVRFDKTDHSMCFIEKDIVVSHERSPEYYPIPT